MSGRERSRWEALRGSHGVARSIAGVITFVGTVVGLLLALGLIHPLGGDEAALAAAATKISDAGSARVVLALTVQAGSKKRVDQGQGAMDFRTEIGNIDYSSGLKQRLRKPYLYQLGSSRKPVWCKYDLSVLGGGFFFGALTGFKSDPAEALINLEKNGTYEELGEERLFGVTTTHYSGHVDLSRLLEGDVDPLIRRLIEQFSRQNDGKLAVDVWLSPDNVVSRLGTSFELGKFHIDGTYGFSHYGIKVDTAMPPESRIALAGTQGCPAELS